MNILTLIPPLKSAIIRRSPEILTGFGIAGMIFSAGLAVAKTPKALRLIETAEAEKGIALTKPEIFHAAWKCYILPVSGMLFSAACIVGGRTVSARRGAAFAAAYRLSETAFREYREKVTSAIGEKKETAIRDEIAGERLHKEPIATNELFIAEKSGTRFFDTIGKRRFSSDIEKIKKAINEINHQMLREDYVSLNEFYYEIGLDETRYGNDLGWHIDGGMIDIRFSAQIDDDGIPCIVLDYTVAPRYDFAK